MHIRTFITINIIIEPFKTLIYSTLTNHAQKQKEFDDADETSKAAQGTCDDLTGELKYLHSQLSSVKQSSRDSDALVLTLRQDLDNAISEVIFQV